MNEVSFWNRTGPITLGERRMLYALGILLILHILWPGIHNKPTWPKW